MNESKKQPAFIYMGNDEEYFKEINSIVAKKTGSKVAFKKSKLGSLDLERYLVDFEIYLVFVDFSDEKNYQDLVKYIQRLKQSEFHQSVMFVAVEFQQKSVEFNRQRLLDGFSLILIKGNDDIQLILEAFSICFNSSRGGVKFAEAQLDSLSIPVFIPAAVESISADYIDIETDLRIIDEIEDGVHLKQDFFEYKGKKKFTINSSFENLSRFPFYNHYRLIYPYPGAWDAEDENALMQDTVTTYLDLNSEKLTRKKAVCAFSANSDFVLSLKRKENKSVKEFFVDSAINDEHLNAFFSVIDLGVVFYEVDEELFDYDFLSLLVSSIKSSGRSIVLVVLGSPSTGEALKKLYKTDNIIATSNKLTIELYSQFVELLSKKTSSDEAEMLCFNEGEPCSLFLTEEMKLLKINEHEIQFKISFDLPLYSSFHMNLPIEMELFVTQVDDSRGFKVYTAVIHGVNSFEKEKLRRIVNQFIFSRPKEINQEVIDAIVNNDKKLKSKSNEDSNSKEQAAKKLKEETEKVETIDYSKFKRRKKSSYSKL